MSLDRIGRRIHLRHGEAQRGKQTAEHRAWSSMILRCTVPTSSNYRFYGGRGIAVCERWLTYENFLSDMGRKPGAAHSLDRIDPNGNYELANCRWATQKEQCRNRRTTRWITVGGETRSLAEWGERTGIDPETISYRLKSGWSTSEAVSIPTGARR